MSARFAAAWQAGAGAPRDPPHRLRLGERARAARADRPRARFLVEQHDWRGRGGAGVLELAAAEHARGFDLTRPPLLRVVLVRLTTPAPPGLDQPPPAARRLEQRPPDRRRCPPLRRRRCAAPARGGRFRDYVAWLAERDRGASERFWRERLGRLEAADPAGGRRGRPAGTGEGQGAAPRRLAPAAGAPLRKVRAARARHGQHARAGRLGGAPAAPHRPAGWSLRAHGLGPAARPAPASRRCSACSSTPCRPWSARRRRSRAGDWLRALQADNAELREHEHTPLYEIQRWAGPGGQAAVRQPRSCSRTTRSSAALQAQGTGPLRFGGARERRGHELRADLERVRGGQGLEIALGLRRALARRRRGPPGRRAALATLLERIADAPERRLGELPLVDAAEAASPAALERGRRRARPPGLVHDQVAAQAAAGPRPRRWCAAASG